MKKKDNEQQLLEFSRRLKESMDKAHLNATDLSNRTGIGKSDISNYVNGKYLPKQDRVYLIASVLGVSPSWLYAIDALYNQDTEQPLLSAPVVLLSDGKDSSGAEESGSGKIAVISTEPWNPDDMLYAETGDEDIRIMARGMGKMSPENRKKLLDVARTLFAEDFDEEGNKR